MLNNSVSGDPLPEPAIVAPVHSDNLEPAIQDTLSALANVEARYQHEREQLERRSRPDGMKARWQQELEERHRREREPLVQHLAQGSRMRVYDPKLGADFGEATAPGACLGLAKDEASEPFGGLS